MTRRAKNRQAEDFRREARATFGIRSQVQGVSHAATQPMHVEMDEAKRLATVHDATKASACRLCGVTVAASAGWSEAAGWKLCPACAELLPGGLARVLGELLGMTVTEAEAVEVCARVPCRNPAFFLHRWATDAGQPTRWAHVPADLAERGRAELATMRDHRPRVNSYRTGCAWCGIARSTQWTETPWRIGRGPHAPRVAACSSCEPWVARSGARSEDYGEWRGHLLACCTEMSRPRMAVDFGLKAWFESDPAETAGTDERWQYLGSLRGELRMRVAAMYPRSVTLTAKEQRVLDLQRAVAEIEHPPQRTPLAKL